MARPYRIQYPDAIYHIMNRGLNRRDIFKEASDYEYFLKLCQKSWERWGLEVFAYCLMPNHYHLCLRTPEGNLSRIMRHIDGLYTQNFNRRYGRDGPLFRGRYKAIVVQQEEYLSQLVRYIHLNPVKAKLVETAIDYSYSSHRFYLSLRKAPGWLNVSLVRGGFKSRKNFDQYVMAGSDAKLEKLLSSRRLPVILGGKDFVEKIKKLAPKPDREHPKHERQRLRPAIEAIIKLVSKTYNVPEERIKQGVRGQANEARKLAMWLGKQYGDCSYSQMAKVFKVKSPHTVGWSCRWIERQKLQDKKLSKRLKGIVRSLVE